MYHEHEIKLTPAGAAGSAAASGATELVVNGQIVSIQGVYTTQPATTDITITEAGTSRAILTVTSANTNFVVAPEIPAVSTAGAALVYAAADPVTRPIAIAGRKINVAVAQGDPVTNGVVVRIIVKE